MKYNDALVEEWLQTSLDVAWFSTMLADVTRLHQHFETRLKSPPIMDIHPDICVDITPLYEEGVVNLKELIEFWSKVIERKKQPSPQ